MKPLQLAALVGLGAIWGASFLFIGWAVPEFGPLPLMLIRVVVGGGLLVGLAWVTGAFSGLSIGARVRAGWRRFLVLGLLNSALPFALIAYSELHLTASLAAILNSTTPLFTTVIAAQVGAEPLSRRKLAGIGLGILGVAVLVGGSPLGLSGDVIVTVAASLFGAASYGAGTVYASRQVVGLPAPVAASIQLLSAGVLLAIPASLTVPAALPSTFAITALAALTLLSTTVAYLLYFYLLREVGPTRTASVTFLVPIFGSTWGILLRGEPFTWGMALGVAMILLSVRLVLARPRQPSAAA